MTKAANLAAYASKILSTGNVTVANVAGNLTAGNLATGIITATGNITAGNLTSEIITATGNVTAGKFIGNGALLTGIVAGTNYSNTNVASYLPTYSGNVTLSNAYGVR